jgi:hypothetical protein
MILAQRSGVFLPISTDAACAVVLVVILVVVIGCGSPSKSRSGSNTTQPTAPTPSRTGGWIVHKKLYAWPDRVALRAQPGLKSAVTGFLKEGEEVADLKQKSNIKTMLVLRCKKLSGGWIKIRTKSGTAGWVFEGALSPTRVKPTDWKAIIAYHPGRADSVSEDWSFTLNDINKAVKGKGIQVAEVYKGSSTCVSIGGSGSRPNGHVDLGPLITEHNIAGPSYVLAGKGKVPRVLAYEPAPQIIKGASAYFKLKL